MQEENIPLPFLQTLYVPGLRSSKTGLLNLLKMVHSRLIHFVNTPIGLKQQDKVGLRWITSSYVFGSNAALDGRCQNCRKRREKEEREIPHSRLLLCDGRQYSDVHRTAANKNLKHFDRLQSRG